MAASSTMWRLVFAMLAAVATCLTPVAAMAQSAATLPCRLEPGPTRSVAAVVDGDTLRLDDGVEVRLVGAMAPRASDAGPDVTASWPPAKEAEAALAALVSGQSVALAFAGSRADRYGRVLAHLFLGEADTQIWVQGRMVEMGHARAAALPESDACIGALIEREKRARTASLGLWSHAAYQIRPADRPTELGRYRFSYQLVRGRVERAHQTRGLAILELANNERPSAEAGKAQRGAFRVVWKNKVARQAGLDRAASLSGRNILVRGWIDAHFGPEIEIVAAGQLELED
jgi:endonuclease YncB( thermonuclease family)